MQRKTGWLSAGAFLATILVVVVTANLAAAAYLTNYPVNRGVNRIWQKWQMVERAQAPADYVLLGDSSCTAGLRTDVMSEMLDGSVVNLCTTADATIVNSAWMLERYIERVGPPKAVIIFQTFHAWERPVEPLVAMFDQIPLPTGFWRRMVPPIELQPADEARLITRSLTTLYERNASAAYVAQAQVARLRGEEVAMVSAVDDLQFVLRHQGWVPESTPRPDKVREDTVAHINAYTGKPFAFHPSAEAALQAIAVMAMEHDFVLYASNTSMPRALYASQEIQRYVGEVVASVEPVAQRTGGAYLLQTPPQFEPEEMDNVDHVVGDEATTVLSRALATAILTERGSAR